MKDSIEFVFEKYYKQVGFIKEDTYCLLKKQRQGNGIWIACYQRNEKNPLSLIKLMNTMNYKLKFIEN